MYRLTGSAHGFRGFGNGFARAAPLLGVLAFSSLSGCGGGAGSDSEFASDFVEACLEATNVPEPVCTCMAERAQEELTDEARALLLASLQGDDEAAAEIRGDMAVTEALQAGMFMTQFGTCAESMAP